jgi:formamidopyrimidine-DNA glycosylase
VPELPEVETIVRSLRNPTDLQIKEHNAAGSHFSIIDRVIRDGCVLWERSLAFPGISEFQKQISGQKILAVNRRGKFILITLEYRTLLIHLRMSGDIVVEENTSTRNNKHDRMVLNFEDNFRMVFNDTRKFGRVWLVDDPDTVTGSLGPEPFDEELTPETFYFKTQKGKRQIKPLLLDQTFLAGLGNIYTDESLFKAGIHPSTPSNNLNQEKTGILLQSIREVLNEGIQRNGASIDWVYRGGEFQNHFQVYQRDGDVCYRCGTIIERMVISQRGTHFCPGCQRLNILL